MTSATDAEPVNMPFPETDAVPADRSREAVLWLIPLLIIGAGLLAYHNSFSGAFLLDDEPRIVTNQQIRQLWSLSAFKAYSARPLVGLSLAVNYALGALNVWGYHAFNLAIHLLAALALFGIVRRMLESDKLRSQHGRGAPWLAGAVAIIWIVHPLQTESVTYIIQRAESMMGLLFLLTLYCVIRGASSGSPRRWYSVAVVACALGMGTKEVMVVTPLVVLLYDRTFLSSSFTELFRRRRGLYAGLACTWLVLAAVLASSSVEGQLTLVTDLTPWRYALTQFEVIVHYLRLALWPQPLVFDYAWQLAETVASVVPWALVVLVLLGATAMALRRQYWAGFWGAWFFLTLAPTSSILPIPDAAFEHRMYLPLAAVIVLLVIGGNDALAWSLRRFKAPDSLRGWLTGVLVAAVVLVLASATARRNEDYRDESAMWTDVVAKRPGNPRAHTGLGIALNRLGKFSEALPHLSEAVRIKRDYVIARVNLGMALFGLGRLDEAVAQYDEALSIDPNSAEARNALGAALIGQEKLDEAFTKLAEAVRLNPDSAEAHYNLGKVLDLQGKPRHAMDQYAEALRLMPDYVDAHVNLGAALLAQRRLDEAIVQLSRALRLKPDSAEAHNNLGAALLRQGNVAEAYTHLSEAVRINPNSAGAHYNLGNVLDRQGKPLEAIAQYSETLRIAPDNVDAHINFGGVLLRQHQLDEAIVQFSAALRLKPDSAGAHNNLGATLFQQGKVAESITHFQEVVRLSPNSADAHYNLAVALTRNGKIDEAVGHYSTAVQIDPGNAQGHYDFANALFRQGKLEDALTHYSEALRIAPDLTEARNNRAIVLARLGRPATGP